MKKITIEWQRLTVSNETCPRCGGTEQELAKAVKALADQGITASLTKKEIGKKDFDLNPRESNRILINGRTIEAWLAAKTGTSCCCDACGDAECRTIEYSGQVYETVPAELIIKAAQNAAQKEG